MTNKTNTPLNLRVKIGGQGQVGRTDYYVSHLPSERFLRFIADDIMNVECVEGRNNVIEWILRSRLGESVLYGDNYEKWREQYEGKNPSSELQEALIRDIFTGESHDCFKPHLAIRTSLDVKVDPVYFDIVFEDQKELDGLRFKKDKTHAQYSRLFDVERKQYRHAEELIRLCKQQIGHPVDRVYILE